MELIKMSELFSWSRSSPDARFATSMGPFTFTFHSLSMASSGTSSNSIWGRAAPAQSITA